MKNLCHNYVLLLLLLVAFACEQEPAAPSFKKELLITYTIPENWFSEIPGSGGDPGNEPDLYLLAFDKSGKRLASVPLEPGKPTELWSETAYTEANFNLGLAMVHHDRKSINISAFTEVPVGQAWEVESFAGVPQEQSFNINIVNPAPQTAYYFSVNGTDVVVPEFSEFSPSGSSTAYVTSPLMLHWQSEGTRYYKYLENIDFSATNHIDVAAADGVWKWKTLKMPFQSKQFFYFDALRTAKQPQNSYEKISFNYGGQSYTISSEGTLDIHYPDGLSFYEFSFSDMNSHYRLAFDHMPDRLDIPVLSFSVLNPAPSSFEAHLEGAADVQTLKFFSDQGYATFISVHMPGGHTIFNLPDLRNFFPAEVQIPAQASFSFMSTGAVVMDNINGYAAYLEAARSGQLPGLAETARVYIVKEMGGDEGQRRLQQDLANPFGIKLP